MILIKSKADYYRLLNQVRTENVWKEWIMYMLDGVEKTSMQSVTIIEEIMRLMQEYKYILREEIPKIYSKNLLELLFKHPYTKINFLVEELGITRKTATTH